ncbi:MAG: hypothetical protein Q9227_005483 [Pyrenula ochraceoflavens]
MDLQPGRTSRREEDVANTSDRYILTYTPAADRILPAPTHLHVRIKNTSAIPLRAAYLHGPYNLYVACYPSTFNPNEKHENQEKEGSPAFEPLLKAGGHWSAKLTVPEDVRLTAGGPGGPSLDQTPGQKSFKWVIEIASQILFSTSATVNYELLVGRDEKSVDFGFHMVTTGQPKAPGRLEDQQQTLPRNASQQSGIYSRAVSLLVEDTDSLWNQPAFPSWDDANPKHAQDGPSSSPETSAKPSLPRKRRKVHLVILTHGIHSNLGADMLYLKESIDAAARVAREDSRKAKAELREKRRQQNLDRQVMESRDQRSKSVPEAAVAPTEEAMTEESDDDEQVIVRGFSGNVVRTERGIQFLGKRLAKYALSITYPDQPFLPVKSSISRSIARSFTNHKDSNDHAPSHKNSSIHKDEEHTHGALGYKITSISFIGHSLGGLVQTYAIAYIQKHSPDFFERIKPVNFVALASPFLGLSNENPMYVKFALDFGLVGRTGQDLGLTWRPPTMVRSGWGAMIGGLGTDAQKAQRQQDPGTKPLLRVLPTGPAHTALQKFRNRTVYSNVVNDGIVPLRTSCLLFLDWRGLGRVEKARRDMGLVGSMVGWGWNEMTGANASSPRPKWADIFSDSGEDSEGRASTPINRRGGDVPQPAEGATVEDDIKNVEKESEPSPHQFVHDKTGQPQRLSTVEAHESSKQSSSNAFSGFLSLFRPGNTSKSHHHPPKNTKIYRRGQTMHVDNGTTVEDLRASERPRRTRPVRGASLYNEADQDNVEAPPKTTFFESAGDLLNPPLPSKQFLIDPSSRPRTIFHDRVYHPEDIPPPPSKKPSMGARTRSKESMSRIDGSPNATQDAKDSNDQSVGSMKIEEKIARAYHKDLSWRKVLVRLEPDAHNNIIVRRMFANAYGWPVIQHLVDTHFAYTAAAQTDDTLEENVDRAKETDVKVSTHGEHVMGQSEPPPLEDQEDEDRPRSEGGDTVSALGRAPTVQPTRPRTESEVRESRDEVPEMKSPGTTAESSYSSAGRSTISRLLRQDSARWSDRFFEGSDDDDVDSEVGSGSLAASPPRMSQQIGTSEAEIADFLSTSPKKEKALKLPSKPRPLGTESEQSQTRPKDGAPEISTLGLTGVGLQKSPLEENIGADGEDAEHRTQNLSVSEQVAFANAKKAGVQDGNEGS